MVRINLRRMRQLMRETHKLLWKLEKAQAYATRSSAPLSELPWGRGNRSRVEEGAIRISELREAYEEALDELGEMRSKLDPMISGLKNADDRAVMRLRCIKGFDPDDISEAVCLTERMIYYILRRSEDQIARMYPDKVWPGR